MLEDFKDLIEGEIHIITNMDGTQINLKGTSSVLYQMTMYLIRAIAEQEKISPENFVADLFLIDYKLRDLAKSLGINESHITVDLAVIEKQREGLK